MEVSWPLGSVGHSGSSLEATPRNLGGNGLAFACDVRIAVSSATFVLSEVKLGLVPALISKYLCGNPTVQSFFWLPTRF